MSFIDLIGTFQIRATTLIPLSCACPVPYYLAQPFCVGSSAMQPFAAHSRFFSTLKQVEKRLASEARANEESKSPHVAPPPPPSPSDHQLSSPIFLEADAERTSLRQAHLQDSSGPPLNFLSSSSCPEDEPQKEDPKPAPAEDDAALEDGEATDDIERLMSLLGLTASEDCSGEGSSCDCSGGGFYSKVAGVRGPKCGRERKRLDGWIEHYYKGRKEPARLAHLLLAKASCFSGDDDDGLGGGIEFPVTVEEFLEFDSPEDE